MTACALRVQDIHFMQVYSTVVDMSNRIENENVGGKIMEFSEFATQKLLEATGRSEHLTDREKHLIGLAVTATRGCIACTGNRLKRASQAGIPYETLVAGIDLAAAVNAGVTIAIATQGAERSGIVKPEFVCADEACVVGLPRS
jgi:alkylhydroperoxidase/carboxymuconolactone decarboxylase family protein YurZ